MTRRRRVVAALSLAAGLTVLATIALQAGVAWTPIGDSSRRDSTVSRPIGPSSPPPSKAEGPSYPRESVGTSLHVDQRYLRSYDSRRAGWADLLDAGRKLPQLTSRCAHSWRTAGKDRRVEWDTASFLCLNSLRGKGYKPQGIGGSATTQNYLINGKWAGTRNLILTTWYARTPQSDLVAPTRDGESATRLVVLDMDRRRYSNIELVQPDGRSKLRSLNSHGSGVAWAGKYIYTSTRSTLWMFNADDLMKINGRFVLPAVAKWSVSGPGGLSSISIDRSRFPSRLFGIHYSKHNSATVVRFDLNSDGSLADHALGGRDGLVLRNRFGEHGRVIRSAETLVLPGSSFQGVGRVGAYGFANSSAMNVSSRSGKGDATVVFKNGAVVERFQMPYGNVQSIYVNYARGTFVSLTEAGSQFLFELPLRQLAEPLDR